MWDNSRAQVLFPFVSSHSAHNHRETHENVENVHVDRQLSAKKHDNIKETFNVQAYNQYSNPSLMLAL